MKKLIHYGLVILLCGTMSMSTTACKKKSAETSTPTETTQPATPVAETAPPAPTLQGEELTAALKEFDMSTSELMKLSRAVQRGEKDKIETGKQLIQKQKELETKIEQSSAALSEENKNDFARLKERLAKYEKEFSEAK